VLYLIESNKKADAPGENAHRSGTLQKNQKEIDIN
jgi:hypothetical protein